MAISGWYHIPQIGEDGYVEGEEQKWGTNSSLKQLQGNPDRYDFPKSAPITLEPPVEPNEEGLDPAEFDFLIKYMAPGYLTPDTLEQVSEQFIEMSSVTLDGLLSNKFSARVREYIEAQEANPESSQETEMGSWKVARPPHKHRFLYRHPSETPDDSNPLHELLDIFLPSEQFRKWLALVTKCSVQSYELLGRRFRRGQDYSLATTHDGEPRLEISLGLTPTPGWGADEAEEDEDEGGDAEEEVSKPKKISANRDLEGESEESEEASVPKEKTNGNARTNGKHEEEESEEEDDVGGHEVYMAGDDDDEDNEDAAIYKTSSDADEDNVLFTMPASWNKMSIVLRDSGVLKFVKYVSRNAKGDRWDLSGSFGVLLDEDEGEGEEEMVTLEESSDEGVFKGFPDSDDSDSD